MGQKLHSQCWLTGHRKRKGGEQKRTRDSKSSPVDGDTGQGLVICVVRDGLSKSCF